LSWKEGKRGVQGLRGSRR